MPKCQYSGQCCTYEKNGKRIKCKFLIKTTTRYLCRIYKTRLNTIIDKDLKIRCGQRNNTTNDFIGCEYNTNKPVINGFTGEKENE